MNMALGVMLYQMNVEMQILELENHANVEMELNQKINVIILNHNV